MLITSNARIGTKHPAYKTKKLEDPLQLQLQMHIHNINIIQRVGKGESTKKGLEITEQETNFSYVYNGDWTETVLGRSYLRSILPRLPNINGIHERMLEYCYRARWPTYIWSSRTHTVHLDRDCESARRISDKYRVEIAITWQIGIGPSRTVAQFRTSVHGRSLCEQCRNRGPHQGGIVWP